jgi:hypothetical protein
MMSCCYDGKVLDFNWKKRQDGYLFRIGDILIGEVYRVGNHEWSAHGWGTHHPSETIAPLVDGFGSRYHCAAYLLKTQGYWRNR